MTSVAVMIAICLLVVAGVAVTVVRRRVMAGAHPSSYLGFPVSELVELARRLDAVEAEYQRARVLDFTTTAASRQDRLLAIRTLGSAHRGFPFSSQEVRVQLLFEGQVYAEGVASLRELAAFVPVSKSGAAPRLVGAALDGAAVVMVFESDQSSRALSLRLVDLALD